MDKLTLLILILLTAGVNAQNVPIDFEAGGNGASWNWTVFENSTNPPLEIVANPDTAGNNSDSVAKFTALQLGQPFAGVESQHGAGIGTFVLDTSTSIIKIQVWKPVISDVGIKLVDVTSGSLGEIKVANTLTNQWEELEFDFSSREGITYDQIVIFPDFNARISDNVCYFDNIRFCPQPPPVVPLVAAPTPMDAAANVISLFSNAYTDVPVNTWRTVWSNATLTDVQVAGDDTKLYTALDFVGIETVGANLVDASAMQNIHLDIWTPNMTVFRIKLVDFGADLNFGGGDDSEHELVFNNPTQETWVSYDIPLSDFTGLTSTSHLAQYILSGVPAGAATVYVDNVYFSKSCNAPENLSSSNLKSIGSQSKATLNWNSVASASSYIINGGIQGSNPNSWLTIPFAGTSLNATNLSEVCYVWRVRAVCGSDTSDWSAIDTFCIPTCAPPFNLSATVGPTSVTFSWTVPASSKIAYLLEAKVNTGGWGGSFKDTISPGSATSVTYPTGSVPSGQYKWRMLTGCNISPLRVSPFTPDALFILPSASQKVGQSGMALYPNPAYDNFTIAVIPDQSNPNYQIEVFDLDGRLLYKEITQDFNETISTDNYKSGIYNVRITQGDKQYIERLVILK